jgi:serine protease
LFQTKNQEEVMPRSNIIPKLRRLTLGTALLYVPWVAVMSQNSASAQAPSESHAEAVQEMLERPLEPQFVPGEVIVKLKPGTRALLSPAEVAPLGLEPLPRRTSGGELVYQLAPSTVRGMQPQEAQNRVIEAAKQFNAKPEVEYAQPNWILQPLKEPNDPRFREQWHYLNNGSEPGASAGGINLPKAWESGTGSSAVVIGVIDTGILPKHPDIVGSPNLGAGYDMISNAFVANDGDGRDSDPSDTGDAVAAGECGSGTPARPSSWHGTHVAGTIGVGNTDNGVGMAGVNWKVTVLPIRVLGKCGGTILDINDAIRWAAGLPVPGIPNNPRPARVINLSLGGGIPCSNSPATQSAINDAMAAGTLVVAAAGNDAQEAGNYTPAGCDNVVTVAASDARGHLARYSNFGPQVEIMAPGGDRERDDNGDGNPDGVLSTVNGGYEYYNGTSMATPHAAGVAALLLAAEPALTPAQLLSRLQERAIPRSDTECPKPCGAGLLNASFPVLPSAKYEYAAKLVCGPQLDARSMRLALGFYATTINVHNPGSEEATVVKTLALTVPPGGQRPGEVLRIAEDKLGPEQAMAVDCEDIRDRAFGGKAPAPYIEAFVVIRSTRSLNVTAVYTTATVSQDGVAKNHSSIHVEQIQERAIEDAK